MRRIIVIFIICASVTFICCQAHYKSVRTNTTFTDSIKSILNIDDSIVVLFDGSEEYSEYEKVHIVIIDYNLNSRFHKQLIERIDKRIPEDSALITEVYKKFQNTKITCNVSFPEMLQGYWYQVEKMDGIYYLHTPCCFAPIDMINDTTFLDDNMMGGVPSFLVEFQIVYGKYIFTTKKYDYESSLFSYSFTLEPIDKDRMIYKFSDGSKCEYLIHESKINTLPIIYEYCNMLVFSSIVFDSVNCE